MVCGGLVGLRGGFRVDGGVGLLSEGKELGEIFLPSAILLLLASLFPSRHSIARKIGTVFLSSTFLPIHSQLGNAGHFRLEEITRGLAGSCPKG